MLIFNILCVWIFNYTTCNWILSVREIIYTIPYTLLCTLYSITFQLFMLLGRNV